MEIDKQTEGNDDPASSSDDSGFEEVDVSMEDMAEITKLETDLEANPNTYDVHVKVISQRVLSYLSLGVLQTFTCICRSASMQSYRPEMQMSPVTWSHVVLHLPCSTSPCCGYAR
jgi:hypothetical protein